MYLVGVKVGFDAQWTSARRTRGIGGFGNDEASVKRDPLVTPAGSTRRGRTADSTTAGAARLAPRRRRAARHSDIRGARQYRAGYRRADRDATEPGDFYRGQSPHGATQRRY